MGLLFLVSQMGKMGNVILVFHYLALKMALIFGRDAMINLGLLKKIYLGLILFWYIIIT